MDGKHEDLDRIRLAIHQCSKDIEKLENQGVSTGSEKTRLDYLHARLSSLKERRAKMMVSRSAKDGRDDRA